MDRAARVKAVTQRRHEIFLDSAGTSSHFFMYLLGALMMLVMAAFVPLVLYWLWM